MGAIWIGIRLPPRNRSRLPPAYGMNCWLDVRGDVLAWIVDELDRDPGYRRAYRLTHLADEIFFNTLLMNSAFAPEISVVVDPEQHLYGLRYIRWGDQFHPETLTDEDLAQADRARLHLRPQGLTGSHPRCGAERVEHYCRPMDHPWSSALVTGASSGIGEAFGRSLAGAGVDLVLVARRADRLNELADELRARTSPSRPDGPSVEVLVADLVDPAERAQVVARLEQADRPIDLLINCAGIGSAARSWPATWPATTRSSTSTSTRWSSSPTPPSARWSTGAGAGSSTSPRSVGTPRDRTSRSYSASKAFVTSFSESLHEEVRRAGVVVTAVCPGATRTEFGQDAGAGRLRRARRCCGRRPTRWRPRAWPRPRPARPSGSPAGSTG